MICVIDYGMGNLGSVCNALAFLGAEAKVSNDAEEISQASAYVLPGVGAFGEAMARLEELHIIEVLTEQVIDAGKPFLGICLGMQLLARDSQEGGHHEGLGWIDGQVIRLTEERGVRVPHVGWASLEASDDPLFARTGEGASFYFDHSYHLVCDDTLVTATCDFGSPVIAALRKDNIFGVQFHPEKSQRSGLKLLRGFLNHCGEMA